MAHLEGANLTEAHLEESDLSLAYLEGANLTKTHLERANLNKTHLEQVNLDKAYLEEENHQPTTLQMALRNCNLYKRTKPYKAWVNEVVYGHSYSRIVTESEDGTIILDRTFTEAHPYDSYIYDDEDEFTDPYPLQGGARVYRHTIETFPTLNALIEHIQANKWRYDDVKPDKEEWHY
jgi:uncharacterized protein YjbI with pentapeptide repeats